MAMQFKVIATLRVAEDELVVDVEVDDGPAGILRAAHQFWKTVSSVTNWEVVFREPETGSSVTFDGRPGIDSAYIFRQQCIYHYVQLREKVSA